MKKENEKAILPISAIANTLDVHQRTIRIYDKEGILSSKRSEKNRRYYSLTDLEKAKFVNFLTRNIGVNLQGVKIIIALMKELNIEDKNLFNFIQEIAQKANISVQEQEQYIKKSTSKGRKPKNL